MADSFNPNANNVVDSIVVHRSGGFVQPEREQSGLFNRGAIVRAIGPSLPVSGALGDPTLELHDGNGALIATTIPPTNDLESAIVRDLTPGNYTAIVRGVNNTTGVASVEVYGLN